MPPAPQLPSDPLSKAIDKSIEQAAAIAKDYLDKLIAPGLEQGGGIISDTVAYWRFKNMVSLVLKAKGFLEAKGIDPKRLLPNVVAPLLEAGSLDTSDDMAQRWSALLASAAAEPERVPPSFPRMLAEISAIEARILEWMEQRVTTQVGWVATWDEIREEFQIDTSTYQVLTGNLVRLNLCRASVPVHDGDDDDRSSEWIAYQRIEFTRLGYAFVHACQPARWNTPG